MKKRLVIGSPTSFKQFLREREHLPQYNPDHFHLVANHVGSYGFRFTENCGWEKKLIVLNDASFSAVENLIQRGFRQ